MLPHCLWHIRIRKQLKCKLLVLCASKFRKLPKPPKGLELPFSPVAPLHAPLIVMPSLMTSHNQQLQRIPQFLPQTISREQQGLRVPLSRRQPQDITITLHQTIHRMFLPTPQLLQHLSLLTQPLPHIRMQPILRGCLFHKTPEVRHRYNSVHQVFHHTWVQLSFRILRLKIPSLQRPLNHLPPRLQQRLNHFPSRLQTPKHLAQPRIDMLRHNQFTVRFLVQPDQIPYPFPILIPEQLVKLFTTNPEFPLRTIQHFPSLSPQPIISRQVSLSHSLIKSLLSPNLLS